MSDIRLNLNSNDDSEMVLRIDLGQSLMRAETIGRPQINKTSQQTVHSRQLRTPKDIVILRTETVFRYPNLRSSWGQLLLSPSKPLTPQMAELTFKLKVPEKIESLEIRLSVI